VLIMLTEERLELDRIFNQVACSSLLIVEVHLSDLHLYQTYMIKSKRFPAT
jgi:hypothetical protein